MKGGVDSLDNKWTIIPLEENETLATSNFLSIIDISTIDDYKEHTLHMYIKI